MRYPPPNCDEVSHELSHCKEDHMVGRETTPLISNWVALENLKVILNTFSTSPSNVDLVSHHNSMCPCRPHWHISTSLPLQLSLGVEDLGLEGRENVCP